MLDQAVWRREESNFLYLRYEIMQLFEFDQYMALVTTALIGWHTHELNVAFKDNKPRKELWFGMSKRFLRICCMGMVGERKIDECVARLQDMDYLEIKPPSVIGGHNQYLLNVPKLNKDLKALPESSIVPDPEPCPNRVNGYVAAKNNALMRVRTDADEPSARMRTSVRIDAEHKEISVLSNKEEPINTNPVVPLPITGTEDHPNPAEDIDTLFDEDSELTIDNISEWVQDLFHEQTGRQYSTIMGKDRGKFVAMSESLGTAGLRAKIKAFIDSGGKTPADFLRQMPTGMTKQSRLNEPYRGSVVRERRSDESYVLPRRSTQPSASTARIEQHSDATRDLVLRWNMLVPDRKVEFEGTARGYSIAMLEQMRLDTEFMANYDAICRKASAIVAAKKDEASWLNFGWLFRIDKGGTGLNWGKLVRRDLDFMLKSSSSGGESEGMSNAKRLLAKLRGEKP